METEDNKELIKRGAKVPLAMSHTAIQLAIVFFFLLLFSYCRSGGGGRGGTGELEVHRGTFRSKMLLTGTLKAVKAEQIVVPRNPTWMTKIRWMVPDGSLVKSGQKILDLDDSAFSGDLEEKKLNAQEIADQIDQQAATLKSQILEKEYLVEEKRIGVEKAKISAAIPAELQPRRDYEQYQLALAGANSEYDKAVEDLKALKVSAGAQVNLRKIELEKARREIRKADEAVRTMTISAPKDGIAEVGEHPWEGRKFQVGDSAWVGMTVISIPDLSKMMIEAKLYDVDDGRIAPQLKCSCTMDTFPKEPIPGVITSVTPIARETERNPLMRSFRVAIDLSRSDPEKMRPGMSVKVEVPGPEIKDALLIPRASIDFSASPTRALLAGGGWAEVKVGACGSLDCILESGLSDGTGLGRLAGGGS